MSVSVFLLLTCSTYGNLSLYILVEMFLLLLFFFTRCKGSAHTAVGSYSADPTDAAQIFMLCLVLAGVSDLRGQLNNNITVGRI